MNEQTLQRQHQNNKQSLSHSPSQHQDPSKIEFSSPKLLEISQNNQTETQTGILQNNCKNKPFLIAKNDSINDEFVALYVMQRVQKFSSYNKEQQTKLQLNKEKCLQTNQLTVCTGTTLQQQMMRIPNISASMCGNASKMLQSYVNEANSAKKTSKISSVFSSNTNVQQIQKIATFSSKFIRPYLKDCSEAPQPTSKIELISSQISMTTSLRAIMSNSFSIECLKQSRLDYMKPMLKMITTQFGLLDQKLEKKLMAFFCFCYSYFQGGAAEAVNDLLIFKKIQQHHRLSTKIINPPPKLTPETKAEVEDYLIRLINTPDVSLYSLREDLGVGRILNYCTICGLMGIDPVILNVEEEVVQQELSNIIIKTEDQQFYQEKQVFQFLLNPVSGLDCGGCIIDFELIWTDEAKQQFESPQTSNEKKLKGSNVKFSAVFDEACKNKNEVTSVDELRKVQDCKRQEECIKEQTIYPEKYTINTLTIPVVYQTGLRSLLLEKKKVEYKIMKQRCDLLQKHRQKKKESSSDQMMQDIEFVKKSNETHQRQVEQQKKAAASLQQQFSIIKQKIYLLQQKAQLEHRLQMKQQQYINNKKQKLNALQQKSVGLEHFMKGITESIPRLKTKCVDLKKQKLIALISLAQEVCDHYQGQLVEKAEVLIEEKEKNQDIRQQKDQLSAFIDDIKMRYDEVQKKIIQVGEEHVKQKQHFQLIVQKEENDNLRRHQEPQYKTKFVETKLESAKSKEIESELDKLKIKNQIRTPYPLVNYDNLQKIKKQIERQKVMDIVINNKRQITEDQFNNLETEQIIQQFYTVEMLEMLAEWCRIDFIGYPYEFAWGVK